MRSNLVLSFLLALTGAACGPSEGSSSSGSSGGAGSGGSGGSGSGGSGSGAGGTTTGPTEPDPAFLPQASSACPELAQGKHSFSPDGQPRDVEIWMSDKALTLDGPLVFFWHGAGGSPLEATYVMGTALQDILDLGGIVAAPYHDPTQTTLPWFLSVGGSAEDDLRVADEVLACAIEKVGVDLRRIHSVGFSAGAMNTTQFAARRSGYLASVVVYSGARLGTVTEQDPSNKYAAMLFHGGPSDKVIIEFATQTQTYHDALAADGHFSFICNHGKGHTVPSDARPSAWRFLQDHPFGVTPVPYAAGLPADFPAYCAL